MSIPRQPGRPRRRAWVRCIAGVSVPIHCREKLSTWARSCAAVWDADLDFGSSDGLLTDAGDGRRRVVKELIFTAVYSRHMFVYPTYRETLGEVVAGFGAVWGFFDGVFATDPRLNDSFREYAESPWVGGGSGSDPQPAGQAQG